MMLGRQRASVEEGRVEGGRVDEGNERGRDGTRHGQREGGSERRRDLARNGGEQKGGKLQGRYHEEGTGQYDMILCDGNYGLGAYGMDSVHNTEGTRAKPGNHLVIYKVLK